MFRQGSLSDMVLDASLRLHRLLARLQMRWQHGGAPSRTAACPSAHKQLLVEYLHEN